MKIWKKNLIAGAILVTVCAGIYLNWSYSNAKLTADFEDTLDKERVLACDLPAQDGAEPVSTMTDYFAAVRLSRQEARDGAVNLLQEAMAYDEDEKDSETSRQLDDLVQTALSEAQIESLVIAKGYRDCVAYMSEDGISVAVAAPEGGLKSEDVAVIADIVMTQSDYGMDAIRVVEVQ